MPSHSISALLELLVERAGCAYLSDLHARQFAQSVCEAVDGVDGDAFSARAWNGAIRYITGQAASFSAVAEARAFLTAHLSQPPEES